jgi:hypothetical protein
VKECKAAGSGFAGAVGPHFNRFAVTQEINDGLLAQRFAPSQRAYVLSGPITSVNPAVPASIPPPGGG